MINDINAYTTKHAYSSRNHSYASCSGLCNDDGQGIPGEQSLWRAVITQALMDASSNSKKVIDKVERARALAWFSMRNKDFLLVCALADLDPRYVLKKVKEAIARGCKWRQKPKNTEKTAVRKKKKTTVPLKFSNVIVFPGQRFA